MSWFKIRGKKRVEEDQKITLVKVFKKDMLIKEIIETMILDRIQ